MALPLCPDQFWLFYSEFQPRIRTAGAYIPAACPLLFGGWGAGFDRSCIFFYLWTVHICLVEKKRVSIRSCSTHRVRNVSQKSYNWWRHGQTLLWLAQLVSRYKYGYVSYYRMCSPSWRSFWTIVSWVASVRRLGMVCHPSLMGRAEPVALWRLLTSPHRRVKAVYCSVDSAHTCMRRSCLHSYLTLLRFTISNFDFPKPPWTAAPAKGETHRSSPVPKGGLSIITLFL